MVVVVVVVVIPFGGENTAHSSYVEARKNRYSKPSCISMSEQFRWQNVFNFRYEWIRSGCRRDLGIAFFCLNIQNSKALSLSWLTEPWDTAILIIGPKEAALLLSTSFSAAILLHSNLGAFFSYPETDVSERGGVDLSDWQN